jgi:hypothetical protein
LRAVNHQKLQLQPEQVAAGEPLCKLVAVDWLKGKDRMNHVAGHPHSLVQVLLLIITAPISIAS